MCGLTSLALSGLKHTNLNKFFWLQMEKKGLKNTFVLVVKKVLPAWGTFIYVLLAILNVKPVY